MNDTQAENIFHSIPRREQLLASDERRLWLPQYRDQIFQTTLWQSLGRLFTWLRVVASVLLGNLLDQLFRRDTVERRAVRLRQALERAGGTLVKLGQHSPE